MTKSEGEVRRGACPVCTIGCPVKVHIQDGQVVKITGDRGARLCGRAVAAVDMHYHPDRVNYPLKRVGERGEGKWEQITWEQAMDEIAQKLDSIRTEFGPEAIALMGGGSNNPNDYTAWRWANLWGTPNIFWQGKNCGEAEFLAECAIYGYITMGGPIPDTTKCAIIWGANPSAQNEGGLSAYTKSKSTGMKLVVVDPRLSHSAREANIWVQLRPGTDGALALGMMNVIINEELYDKAFVEKWCLGFDELRSLVQKYPPDKAADITWVPKEQIIEVARLYATSKPAFLSWGVACCHLGNGATLSAVVGKSFLRAITGNLDLRGGNTFYPNPEITAYLDEIHRDKLIDHPLRKRDNVSAHVWPIASIRALKQFQEAQGKVYPRGVGIAHYFQYPSSRYLWSAILEENPYPLKAVFFASSNPLVTLGNARRIHRALKSSKLALLVAVERWMTPSAQMADYVLPSATAMERPHMTNSWGFVNAFSVREKAVEPLYDRRDDYFVWRDLGNRLGQEGYWPETAEQWYDKMLEPEKVTFKELVARDRPTLAGTREYNTYEKKGFATFSGKVELTCSFLEKLGYPALPDYKEPPWSPVSTPELAKEYPLILISGRRVRTFFHTQHRQLDKLRRRYPDPLLQIHPETAKGLGIANGDSVYIETPLGRIRQKAKLTEGIDPRVVHADGYWWFPEMPAYEPGLSGAWESNINAILPDDPEMCDYTGDNPFRALLCRIYKSKEL